MRKNGVALLFSKDRAMQLCAAIESFHLHCRDSHLIQLCVLYKASDPYHVHQYAELKVDFPHVSFIEETDFEEQLLDKIAGFEYVLFMVDDNLFVRQFHLGDVFHSLQDTPEALGFSLRLGRNTDYCYSHDTPQALPAFVSGGEGILSFDWTAAQYDFAYPLEVSSSVYRVAEILPLLEQISFDNPNMLEALIAANIRHYAQARNSLLCFERSVAFCNPVNMVQSTFSNRSGLDERYTPDKLAEMFSQGLRIDVERYSGLLPSACHQEVELHFRRGLSQPPTREAKERFGVPNTVRDFGHSLPRFSIVTANYNRAAYIAQAIESVLQQSFEDWELIVVDDGSTDDSVAVVNSYLGDNRIRLLKHDTNRGYTTALKTGIASVRSELFGILDSDDCLAADAVEIMHDQHCKFPDCGLIYSQFMHCNEALTPRESGFCASIPESTTSLDMNVVSHFKTFKLRDYLQTEGYDEDILYAEDIDIIYKMEEVTTLRFVEECLYYYRELPDSICHCPQKVNVAIMSRVKARINALRRRSLHASESGHGNFGSLFRLAIEQARKDHPDVEQYFVILKQMNEQGMFESMPVPDEFPCKGTEDRLLWLAANVDIEFDKLFASCVAEPATSHRPFVSVYMVTYNCERFIAQAIDSVLAQTYDNIELLVVDDGSTDGTAELVGRYSDSRLRYIRQAHRNFAAGMNRAILEANGEFVLGVDSDDWIDVDYIEKMVACARRHPDADYFYPARLTLVDECGTRMASQWEYLDFSDNSILPAFIFANGFGPIPNPGSLKRRSLFDRTGPYEELETVEDFVFLCRNALKIRFRRVDGCSAYFYRRLESGNSRKFEARDRIMADALNEMVSIYPQAVLCPGAKIHSDGQSQTGDYEQFLAETFFKHAESSTVRHGEYYLRYGRMYRKGLVQSESNLGSGGSQALLSGISRNAFPCPPDLDRWMSERTLDFVK